MGKKNTSDLQSELSNAPTLQRFLSLNQKQFVNEDFVDLLQEMLLESGQSKSSVAKKIRNQ